MSAYYILTQTITDTERYQKEYIPGVMPFLEKYKGEVIVAELETEPLQGDPPKGAVVIRFPSESRTLNWRIPWGAVLRRSSGFTTPCLSISS